MKNKENEILSLETADLKKLLSVFSSLLGIKELTPISLSQYADKFIEKLSFSSSKSYLQNHKISTRYLLNYLGSNTLLTEISTEQIQSLLVELQKRAPKGYRSYFKNFKVFFNRAIDQNYLRDNPCRGIKLAKRQQESPKVLSRNELNELLVFVKAPHIKEIIIFGYNTGCRLSEIINLQWSNINLVEKTITIGSKTFQTKSRKQRIIPMQKEVFEQLQKLRPKIVELEGHYIFRSLRSGKKFTADYVSRKFKQAVRAANLSEDYHFHSLRHSFASNLVRNNVDIYSVRDLLGHSSVAVTQIYAHNDLDTLRKAVVQLEQV